MLVLFLFLRGIYTYPLKRVAKIIGSLSLVASVVFIALVIILNYDDDISGRSVNQYYHPLVYGKLIKCCFIKLRTIQRLHQLHSAAPAFSLTVITKVKVGEGVVIWFPKPLGYFTYIKVEVRN